MTAIKGLGTYGNAAGVVTPLDHKIAQAGALVKTTTPLKVRAGVFFQGTENLVTGTAGMAYSVAAYLIATQRSAGAGVVLGGNDGALSVATTAAPGSNSRIDIIYHWHREFSLDGTDSNPVIGVVQGTPAASPVAPSLAAFPGAVEIARATVAAGATATNGAGVTITNTCPFTTTDGGVVVVRTTTERDAFTDAVEGQLVFCRSNKITYRWDGSAWKLWDAPVTAFTPTLTSVTLGTGGTNTGRWHAVSGRVFVEGEIVLGTSPAVSGSVTLTTPQAATFQSGTERTLGAVKLRAIGGSPSAYDGLVDQTDANTVRFIAKNASATYLSNAALSSTVPFTWAATHRMEYAYSYIPA